MQNKAGYHGAMDQGQISERGMGHAIDCVAAMKEVLGDKVSLALDCGPGWFLPDAIRFANAVETYNLMWLEDMLTGDYVPWVNPQAYRELTQSTSVPIHTGEQIYLRHNFKELIETQAVRIVGPDPADIGGMAELKWVAEHAYMHSIMMAPHGTANGLLGLGALINVCATLPANFIAFEYPTASEPWWPEIVTGPAEADRRGNSDDRPAACPWPRPRHRPRRRAQVPYGRRPGILRSSLGFVFKLAVLVWTPSCVTPAAIRRVAADIDHQKLHCLLQFSTRKPVRTWLYTDERARVIFGGETLTERVSLRLARVKWQSLRLL